ncbi:hypothetical protein J6590_047670 [Homalodisca vitripennis]|nr:hypothetical protein J6590_047670 [Homalodisca vitripennis]
MCPIHRAACRQHISMMHINYYMYGTQHELSAAPSSQPPTITEPHNFAPNYGRSVPKFIGDHLLGGVPQLLYLLAPALGSVLKFYNWNRIKLQAGRQIGHSSFVRASGLRPGPHARLLVLCRPNNHIVFSYNRTIQRNGECNSHLELHLFWAQTQSHTRDYSSSAGPTTI